MAEKWAYHLTDHFREKRTEFLQSRKHRAEVVKLHLGCGDKIIRGYVNVDLTGKPDVVADISELPDDLSGVSEIMAIHTFEHIFPWKCEAALKHWYDRLKEGGKLILEMPDLKKVLVFFTQPNVPLSHTMFALYGGEPTGRIEDVHKWAWTFETLKPLFEKVGFKDIVEKPACYHVLERDFRIEGVK